MKPKSKKDQYTVECDNSEQKIIDYLIKKVKLTQEEAEDIVKLVNEK